VTAPRPVVPAAQSIGDTKGATGEGKVKRQSSRCVNGKRRYDRSGHRLRNSRGERIAIPCSRRTAGQRKGKRTGSPVRPNFTG
jgi:hypothetical protein